MTYMNCPIIWVIRLQTENTLSNKEAEFIALSQTMRDVLFFVCLTKKIWYILELQVDAPKVLCSIFEKSVTFHKNNQGEIALTVDPQIWPCTKHIKIKYHQLRIFVANYDIEIQHIDTKEQITDIFIEPLDPKLFGYLLASLSIGG